MERNHLPLLLLATALAAGAPWLSGCEDDGDAPDDDTGDDDVSPDPPEVVLVADGLHSDEPSRYAAQEKLVALGDGALLAVFGDGVEGGPAAYRETWAAVSLDGGATWGEPQRVAPSEDYVDAFAHVGWPAVAARAGRIALAVPARPQGEADTTIFVMYGSWDGAAGVLAWEPGMVRAVSNHPGRGYSFPGVVFVDEGRVDIVSRANSAYDEGCDPETAECPQEQRQVFHHRSDTSAWETSTISEQWTSTVPELAWDPDGGSAGAGGLGRLWATWHNEDRPDLPVGCVVGDVSLWTLDLDTDEGELTSVPGTWAGEPCDADVHTALYPSVAVDSAGNPHVAYAHVDADYRMTFHYTARSADGAWSPPEPVHDAATPFSISASLVLQGDDQPWVVGTREDGDGGALVGIAREDGAWTERMLAWSGDVPLNWPNLSSAPVADGRYGVLFGTRSDEPGGGALYFTTLPDPAAAR